MTNNETENAQLLGAQIASTLISMPTAKIPAQVSVNASMLAAAVRAKPTGALAIAAALIVLTEAVHALNGGPLTEQARDKLIADTRMRLLDTSLDDDEPSEGTPS